MYEKNYWSLNLVRERDRERKSKILGYSLKEDQRRTFESSKLPKNGKLGRKEELFCV